MVKIDANSNHQTQNSQQLLSTLFLAIGALTLVISLILGIKWKRFRYRMTFQNTPGENLITIRRHSTTTTIRENCCEGRYRHSTTEELIASGNDIQPTLRNTSTYNVKKESSDRESIFRWPFKNKMKVSSSNLAIDENRVLDSNDEAVHRRERDSMLAEKNERLRRSIYERLNSTSSMPDLVNDSQPGTYERKFEEPILVFQKGVESELDEAAHYQIVDEIHDTKLVETVPVRVKERPVKEISAQTFEMCAPKKTIDSVAESDEKIEIIKDSNPPKPPVRRRSKASDLTPPKEKKDVQGNQIIPPAVKPRKKISNLTVTIDQPTRQNEEISQNEAALPKKNDEIILMDTDTVDSKQNEVTTLEAIISPPIEYKDTSLKSITVTSEQTEVSSINISTKTLIYEPDSSLEPTPKVSKHEPDSNIYEDAVDSNTDFSVNTLDSIQPQNQDSSLSEEPNSTAIEYPAAMKDFISSIDTQAQEEESAIKSAITTPKSILKSQQDTSQQPKNSTVQFINVPDSSSDEDDDLYEDSNDVWSKIEIHRNQLMMNHEFNRVYISSSTGESPPPLPKTPPPTADIQERSFEFA
ncbi:unnamed protein product [Chironomus riparius]|uniref:Uncharacterized protein n=1 Tax=Chironomus riparius TaxID=315576 RepID=A0A9N9RZC5_9DIPT|nr:unnamed protein product [Chironomus riparius]